MFISGNILVMVVPQITIAPTSLLLSFRGPKGNRSSASSFMNPLSPESVRQQFSLNNISKSSREMVTRIKK